MKPIVHFVIQTPHLADVLKGIVRTNVDIVASQSRALVTVAAILQNGHQRLINTV